jgi:hypothetical protein
MKTPGGLDLYPWGRGVCAILSALAGIGLTVSAAAIYGTLLPIVHAGGGTEPEKISEKNGLSGAELYTIYCNRCHAERYAPEWTSAQWKTLVMHMRVRANLPAAQTQAVLEYLQQGSGQ